jgi:hypothetical protein
MSARPRPPRTPAERTRQRRRENLDMLLGALGFVTAVVFLFTAIDEIKGESSVLRALVLAVLVVLFWATLRLRRKV